jgi:hypothetical protein
MASTRINATELKIIVLMLKAGAAGFSGIGASGTDGVSEVVSS